MKKYTIKLRTVGSIALLFFLTILNGCKKLVEVNAPVTNINSANVYNTDIAATAALNGLYTNMIGLFPNISVYPALSADELTLTQTFNNDYFAYYTNNLNSQAYGAELWTSFYQNLFVINSAIEGLSTTNNLSTSVKQQLLGEAKFLRAFSYFYLVNYYGDVPLALTSDYSINSQLARAPKAEVYKQIVADLIDAQSLLSTKYLDGTVLNVSTQRLRPTKWAAAALLARVYLYTGDWTNAEKQASIVINDNADFGLSTLANAFLDAKLNNKEAIWQLQPVYFQTNTADARFFVIQSTATSPTYLNNNFLNSFEPNDQRKISWIGNITLNVAGVPTTYYFPNKYKIYLNTPTITEFQMVLRLAEVYLIRAEAEANGAGAGINGALSDLNVIRTRAGLPNYAGATTLAALSTAILHERQVELFTEWGHRWLDLKRTNTVDAVMSAAAVQKQTTWNTNAKLYPIPLSDLKADQKLVQNPGY